MIKITSLYIDGAKLGEGCRFCTIDSLTPVFGWAVSSGTDDNWQGECRVMVEGDTLLWDSGWVAQKEQSLRYAGEKLPAGVALTLTVLVRDKNGEESEPCLASFVSGVLTERVGKWIGSPAETNGRVLYFRRDFVLSEMPESACLYVCGLGYHHVTLDGVDVTDAKLEPAHANYHKLVYYRASGCRLPALSR